MDLSEIKVIKRDKSDNLSELNRIRPGKYFGHRGNWYHLLLILSLKSSTNCLGHGILPEV